MHRTGAAAEADVLHALARAAGDSGVPNWYDGHVEGKWFGVGKQQSALWANVWRHFVLEGVERRGRIADARNSIR